MENTHQPERSVTTMTKLITQPLHASDSGIETAAQLLRDGRLVAFPTETVYGLGADARNDTSVAKIFQAKGRPRFNPLIIHVSSLETAMTIARFGKAAERLASAFWPGPLTLVLPLRPSAGISPLVSAGLETVAIRVPAHPLAQALLQRFDGPVAAPSANRSGKISPTNAAHVTQGLSGRIAAVLDGGPCDVGVESTIVGFMPDPVLLRPGGLPTEAIQACLGTTLGTASDSAVPTSPGQLASHYAPDALIRLNVRTPEPGEVLLGFGQVECELNLSPASDMVEAAANLFHHLRLLDASNAQRIAVSPIPDHGLGRAINDRLQRAAAPRP